MERPAPPPTPTMRWKSWKVRSLQSYKADIRLQSITTILKCIYNVSFEIGPLEPRLTPRGLNDHHPSQMYVVFCLFQVTLHDKSTWLAHDGPSDGPSTEIMCSGHLSRHWSHTSGIRVMKVCCHKATWPSLPPAHSCQYPEAPTGLSMI